jgi:pimeloyl-ACP methyl ester carboxylesterase
MVAVAAGSADAAEAKANAGAMPPIYIMRGGLNIFSTGMDVLAKELTDKGYPATSDSFEDWRSEMAKLVTAYKAHPFPIVLIGHSYGAETAMLMAYKLKDANVPVALIVLYDLTSSGKVPANVVHVLNFRSSSSTGIDVTVTGGYGFTGKIDNVTRPDLNHITIDKAEDLHKRTIDAIADLMGKPAKAPKATKTAND